MKGKILTLHEKLKAQQLTSKDLTEKYLNNIKLKNPNLNAYITVTEDEALCLADEADKKLASDKNADLICGIPMALKDNICTKNILTTCGSEMLYNFMPIYNCFAWERLLNKGAVLLGKTNMDEFAMGSTGETSFFGETKNPFDNTCVPGGSSSGSACAVAADMAVFALGSDTGGSIRQPAAFCGLIGLKPTYGAVSRYGLVAYASSFDQIGVLSRSAQDASIVFDRISASDKKDSTCSSKDRKSTFNTLQKDIKGLKIGIIESLFENLEYSAYSLIKEAIKALESLGAVFCKIEIKDINKILPTYYILACAEASSNLARYDGVRFGYRTKTFKDAEEMIVKSRSEAFGTEVKRRILLGNFSLRSDYYDEYYKKADIARKSLTSDFLKALTDSDMIFSPTALSSAFKKGEFKNSDPVKMYLTDLCTVSANITGLPAISIPCGFDKNNMPVGFQLMGRRFEEALLLNTAYKYEEDNHKIMYSTSVSGGDLIEL